MPRIKRDKELKRGDYHRKCYNYIACIKWYDNKLVMLLGYYFEEIASISTVQRGLKGSSSKIPENYPRGIKLYNSEMGKVDLMDQLKSVYQLVRRSKFQFYLRIFFNLFDVALVNSFIVSKKLENKDLTIKKLKICIALKLITSFVNRKLSCPNHRPSKRTKAQRTGSIPASHLPISGRQNDDVLYAPKQEKRTEHLLHVHYVM